MDLDLGQGDIAVPGTICALPIETQIDTEDGLSLDLGLDADQAAGAALCGPHVSEMCDGGGKDVSSAEPPLLPRRDLTANGAPLITGLCLGQ